MLLLIIFDSHANAQRLYADLQNLHEAATTAAQSYADDERDLRAAHQQTLSAVNDELAATQQEVQKYMALHKTSLTATEQLRDEKDVLATENSKIRQDSVNLDNSVSTLKKDISTLEAKERAWLTQEKQYISAAKQASSHKDGLEATIKTLQNDLQTAHAEHAVLKNTVDSMSSTVDQSKGLAVRVHELEAAASGTDDEKASLISKLSDAHKEIDGLKATVQESTSSTDDEKASLTSKLSDAHKEIDSLKATVQESKALTERIKKLEASATIADTDKASLTTKLSDAEKKIEQLKKQCEDASKSVGLTTSKWAVKGDEKDPGETAATGGASRELGSTQVRSDELSAPLESTVSLSSHQNTLSP
jgi:chromosome segregation ATPase